MEEEYLEFLGISSSESIEQPEDTSFAESFADSLDSYIPQAEREAISVDDSNLPIVEDIISQDPVINKALDDEAADEDTTSIFGKTVVNMVKDMSNSVGSVLFGTITDPTSFVRIPNIVGAMEAVINSSYALGAAGVNLLGADVDTNLGYQMQDMNMMALKETIKNSNDKIESLLENNGVAKVGRGGGKALTAALIAGSNADSPLKLSGAGSDKDTYKERYEEELEYLKENNITPSDVFNTASSIQGQIDEQTSDYAWSKEDNEWWKNNGKYISGLGQSLVWMGVGGGATKIAKAAGLGKSGQSAFTAITLTGMEAAGTGSEAKQEVYTRALDRSTNGAYTKELDTVYQQAFMEAMEEGIPEEKAILKGFEARGKKAREFEDANPEVIEEARKLGDRADELAKRINNYNLLLNVTSAKLFTGQGKQTLREIPTLKNTVVKRGKELISEGTQEGIEEGINSYAQDIAVKSTLNEEYTGTDFIEHLKSDELKESVLAGALGGVTNTGGMYIAEAISNRITGTESKIQRAKNRLQEYNDVTGADIEKVMALGASSQNKIQELNTYASVLESIGKKEEARLLRNKIVHNQAINALQVGTQGELIKLYEAQLTSEDTRTVKLAQEAIQSIQEAEIEFEKHQDYENPLQLTTNRLEQKALEKSLLEISNKEKEFKANLPDTLEIGNNLFEESNKSEADSTIRKFAKSEYGKELISIQQRRRMADLSTKHNNLLYLGLKGDSYQIWANKERRALQGLGEIQVTNTKSYDKKLEYLENNKSKLSTENYSDLKEYYNNLKTSLLEAQYKAEQEAVAERKLQEEKAKAEQEQLEAVKEQEQLEVENKADELSKKTVEELEQLKADTTTQEELNVIEKALERKADEQKTKDSNGSVDTAVSNKPSNVPTTSDDTGKIVNNESNEKSIEETKETEKDKLADNTAKDNTIEDKKKTNADTEQQQAEVNSLIDKGNIYTLNLPYADYTLNDIKLTESNKKDLQRYVDFINNPLNDVSNLQTEFEIDYKTSLARKGLSNKDIGYITALQQGRIPTGTISDEALGKLSIKVKFPVGDNIYTFMASTAMVKNNAFLGKRITFQQAQDIRNQILQQKRNVIEAAIKGNTVTAKVIGKTSGKLDIGSSANINKEFQSISDKMLPTDKLAVLIKDKQGNIKFKTADGLITTHKPDEERIGVPHVLTVTANNTPRAIAVETRLLNSTEKELLYHALKKLANKDNNITTIKSNDGRVLSSNLTPRQVVKLLMNTRSKSGKEFIESIAKLTIPYNAENQQEGIKALDELLTKTKTRRNIDANLVSGSIFKAVDTVDNFTLLGHSFDKNNTLKSQYNTLVTKDSEGANSPTRTKYKSFRASNAAVEYGEMQISKKEENTTNIKEEDVFGDIDDLDINPVDETGGTNESNMAVYNSAKLIQDETIPAAKNWLQEVLPQFPTEERETVKRLAGNKLVLGTFITSIEQLDNNSNTKLIYSKEVVEGKEGVIYHEAMHAVLQTLLTEEEYNKYIAIEKELFPDGIQEEGLAELFREFKLTGEINFPANSTEESKNAVIKLFKRIQEYIKSLLGVDNKSKIEKLFTAIDKGKYKDNKVLTDRIKGYRESNSMLGNSYVTIKQAQEYAKSLINVRINKENIQTIHNKKEFNLSPNELANYIKEKALKLNNDYKDNPEQLKIYKKALAIAFKDLSENKSQSLVYQETVKRIEDFIKVNVEIEKEDQRNKESIQQRFDKSQNEINPLERAGLFVKMLLASTPKMDSNGNIKINPNTGLPEMSDFASLHNFLLYELSDLANDMVSGDFDVLTQSAKAKMIARLRTLSRFKPELNYIISVIGTDFKGSTRDVKQGLFFQAFSNAKAKPLQAFKKKVRGGFILKFFRPDKKLGVNKTLQQWDNNLKQLIKDKEPTGVNAEFNKRLYALYVNPDKRNIKNLKFTLEGTGINITEEELNYFLYKQYPNLDVPSAVQQIAGDLVNYLNYNVETTNGAVTAIYGNFLEIIRNNEGKVLSTINNLKDISTIKDLAFYSNIASNNYRESSITIAGNNRQWLYQLPRYIDNLLNGNNEQYISDLLEVDYNKGSKLLNLIQQKAIDFVDLNTFTDIDNNKDAGSKFKDLSKTDEEAIAINGLLQGLVTKNNSFYVRMLSMADKSQQPMLAINQKTNAEAGLFNRTIAAGGLVFNEDGTLKLVTQKEIIDNFKRLIRNEIDRSLAIKKIIDSTNNFDIANAKDNYTRNYLFPELSLDAIIGEERNLNTHPVDSEVIDAFMDSEQLLSFVQEKLASVVNENVEVLIKLGIFNKKDEGYSSNAIASNIQEHYKKVDGSLAVHSITADYVLNSIIANVEFTKALTGDPAFYKAKKNRQTGEIDYVSDFTKRTPSILSAGVVSIPDELNNFKVSIIDTVEFADSNLYKSKKEVVRNIYNKYFPKADAVKESNNVVNPYDSMDDTDAQAYITLDRWKQIQKGLQRWDSNLQSAYDILSNPEIPVEQAIEALKLANQSMQSLKGVHFERVLAKVEDSTFDVPVYLKYSQFVLFPSLVKEFPKLQTLYNKMKDPNGPDEIIYDSGSKGSHIGTTDITQEDYKFNTMNMNASNWKLQVDLRNKEASKEQFTTQPRKNLKANVVLKDKEYNDSVHGDRTGEQVIQETDDAFSMLSNRALSKLEESINSPRKFADMLLANMSRISTDMAISISNRMPLDALPQAKNLIHSTLASVGRKKVLQSKFKGGSLIQVSGNMFTGLDSSKKLIPGKDFIALENVEYLKGARLTEEGKALPTELVIPYKFIKDLEENMLNKSISGEELKNYLSEDVLNGIAYRVPNQPGSSVENFKVVGILPEASGDSVVVYREGTTKYGYDFDVDKLYITLPETRYNSETGKVEVDRSDEKDLSKLTDAQLRNRILDNYKLLMNHPKAVVQQLKPLDSDDLKKDLKNLHQMEYVQDTNFWTTSNQIEIKQNNHLAKGLTGLAANVLTDIPLNQIAKLSFKEDIGLGILNSLGYTSLDSEINLEGQIITDLFSQLLTASVDAAKDPYIVQANINKETFGVYSLLLSVGEGFRFANRFIGQPILKEYSFHADRLKGRLAKQEFLAEEFKRKDVLDYIKETKSTEFSVSLQDALELDITSLSHKVKLMSKVSKNHSIDDKDTSPLERALIQNKRSQEITAYSEVDSAYILALFIKLNEKADIVTQQLLSTKQDVNGYGSSYADSIATDEMLRKSLGLSKTEYKEIFPILAKQGADGLSMEQMQLLIKSSELNNFWRKFDKTAMATYHVNTINFINNTLSNRDITASQVTHQTIHRIANMLGLEYMTNSKTIKTITDGVYGIMLSDFFNKQIKSRNKLLSVLPEVLDKIKITDNDFNYTALGKSITTNEQGFIAVDNTFNKNEHIKERITKDWEDSLNGVYGEDIAKFAKALVPYSYYTSGMRYSTNTFYDYIPSSYLEQQGITDYVINAYKQLNTGLYPINNIIAQILENNYNDTTLVPSYSYKAFNKYFKHTSKGKELTDIGEKKVYYKDTFIRPLYITIQDSKGVPILYVKNENDLYVKSQSDVRIDKSNKVVNYSLSKIPATSIPSDIRLTIPNVNKEMLNVKSSVSPKFSGKMVFVSPGMITDRMRKSKDIVIYDRQAILQDIETGFTPKEITARFLSLQKYGKTIITDSPYLGSAADTVIISNTKVDDIDITAVNNSIIKSLNKGYPENIDNPKINKLEDSTKLDNFLFKEKPTLKQIDITELSNQFKQTNC